MWIKIQWMNSNTRIKVLNTYKQHITFFNNKLAAIFWNSMTGLLQLLNRWVFNSGHHLNVKNFVYFPHQMKRELVKSRKNKFRSGELLYIDISGFTICFDVFNWHSCWVGWEFLDIGFRTSYSTQFSKWKKKKKSGRLR